MRRNPDEELRNLEREAQADPEARLAFEHAYRRAFGAEGLLQKMEEYEDYRTEWRYQQLYDEVHGRGAFKRRTRQEVLAVLQRYLAKPGVNEWRDVSDILQPLLEDGEIDWYDGYAPGSGDPDVLVVVANWNEEDTWDAETRTRTVVDSSLRDIGNLLQAAGLNVELDWSDTVTRCGDCGKAISTNPTSYGWTPPYAVVDSDILCRSCIQGNPSDYLSSLEVEADRALMPSLEINLSDHGYLKIDADYETGFHPGQNDSPKEVAKKLKALGLSKYIFEITDSGQFDISWTVWISRDELEEAVFELTADFEDKPEEITVENLLAAILAILENPELKKHWSIGNVEKMDIDKILDPKEDSEELS